MSRCFHAFLNDLPAYEKKKLDLTFRLSFLEGIARRDPGDWTIKPLRGAVAARSFFESQGIQMDPRWFDLDLPGSPWVVELDQRAYGMLSRWKNSLAAIGIEQDDIVNSLVSSTNSAKGRRQDKVFYSFGLSWANPEKLSSANPANAKAVIGSGLTRAVAQFINDALSRASNQPHLKGPSSEQISDNRNLTRDEQIEYLMKDQPSESVGQDTILIDLLGQESGLASSILQLAESAIDRVTKDEVARFALRRFFTYLTDPAYNVRDPGAGRDKRPNRSKMWALLSRIRDQVREDMLKQFDPSGTKTEEERNRFLRRLYGILGSAGRGSGGNTGLPEGIEKVLTEIRKTPAVQKLIERFQEERERLELHSMTASVVKAFRVRQARASLGLLGVLLERPDLWA